MAVRWLISSTEVPKGKIDFLSVRPGSSLVGDEHSIHPPGLEDVEVLSTASVESSLDVVIDSASDLAVTIESANKLHDEIHERVILVTDVCLGSLVMKLTTFRVLNDGSSSFKPRV